MGVIGDGDGVVEGVYVLGLARLAQDLSESWVQGVDAGDF